jgi:sulfite exporter TauE/SafE
MILLGLYLGGWWNVLQNLERMGGGFWRRLEPLRRRLLPVNNPLKAIAAGAAWGFLPCGMVYSTLFMALARSDSMVSGGIMLAFGLGTLPALLISGALAGQLRQWLQQRSVRRSAGALVMLFGVWTIYFALMHTAHPAGAETKTNSSEPAFHHHAM